nr:YciI family protein [Demequina sp. TTPB684]
MCQNERKEQPVAQYLLTVHNDYSVPQPSEERMHEFQAAVGAFNSMLRDTGAWVFAAGLAEPSSAAVVSSEDGKTLTTAGPYAQTSEHVGGLWVVETADLNEALRLGAQASEACGAPIEVRPLLGS